MKAEIKNIFLALRPQQWVKNCFIFLPLLFGKKLFTYPNNLNTLIYFFIFSLASSAAYLLNDLLDKEEDLSHPIKSLRPIASGKLNNLQVLAISFCLGSLAVAFSFSLKFDFGILIISYLLFNILYTKFLKHIPLVDVLSISCFFLLRIIAGSFAANVLLSKWIIIMAVLLAAFLGLNKRRQEVKLINGSKEAYNRPVLKRYHLVFIDKAVDLVAFLILVVYLLYAIDPRIIKEAGSRHLLFSVPFVYYGVIRYRYLIRKLDRGDGDPTRMFFSDKIQQLNILSWVVVCIAVIYFGL